MITAFQNDTQMPQIMSLLQAELSEPYTIYTYRYFVHSWPQLSLLKHIDNKLVAVIICKLEERKGLMRGYIAMLVVHTLHRREGYAKLLVTRAITTMKTMGANEIVLETEASNHAALAFYDKMGFVRDKKLQKYYLNGVDAYRLKLYL